MRSGRSSSGPNWRFGLMGEVLTPSSCFISDGFSKSLSEFSSFLPAGFAQEVLYRPDFFTYGKSSFAKSLSADAGFAGFRVLTAQGEADWLSFLGASYFRSTGETLQYGLSARGLAIDVAMPAPEEFPHF